MSNLEDYKSRSEHLEQNIAGLIKLDYLTNKDIETIQKYREINNVFRDTIKEFDFNKSDETLQVRYIARKIEFLEVVEKYGLLLEEITQWSNRYEKIKDLCISMQYFRKSLNIFPSKESDYSKICIDFLDFIDIYIKKENRILMVKEFDRHKELYKKALDEYGILIKELK